MTADYRVTGVFKDLPKNSHAATQRPSRASIPMQYFAKQLQAR